MLAGTPHTPALPGRLLAIAATPAVIIFLSYNFVNIGNLLFNLVFSRLMGPELSGLLAFFLTAKLALLGFFAAFQMGVSKLLASSLHSQRCEVEQALSRINRFLLAGLFKLGLPLTEGFLNLTSEEDVARLQCAFIDSAASRR